MNADDPILMAYADGQLDAAEAARVEAAIAADPALAEAVARHRALRARLQQAFAPALDEPVPAALLAAARAGASAGRGAATPADAAPADVASIQDARARRDAARAPRRGPPAWLAMAAVLVLGLAVGLLLGRPATGPVRLGEDGQLLAQGELARALDTQLAAEAGERIAIGLSFRDADGHWCRSFHLRGDAAMAGLACRGDDGGWRLPALAEAAAGGGDLRQAAADLPPAVLAAIDERLVDDAADAEAERAARDAGWR